MADQNPTSNEINTIVDRLGTLHLSTKEFLQQKNVDNFVGQHHNNRVNFSNTLNTFHRQLSVLITRSSEFTPSFISCVKQIHLLVKEIIELDKATSEYKIPFNSDKNKLLEQSSMEISEAFMELHELSISIQNLEKELSSSHR
ncbi:hypothetical protein BDC45DRAFT_536788 [Circinella umbellata]|nr:hypothetical protein BDC45DRAFT_536788 [Circinella umbellata]